MVEWLWQRLLPVATVWNLIVLFLFAAVFSAALFKPRVSTYPTKTFDGRRYGFWPSEAAGILGEFEKGGKLDTYREQEIDIDLIFPVVYTLLLALAIVRIGAPPQWRCPFIAALGDYLENVAVIRMIGHYKATATVPYVLAVLATIGSRIKWGCIGLSYLAVGALLVWRGVRWAGSSAG